MLIPTLPEQPRQIDRPEPGYFAMKLVRGGPYVGARIQHALGFWWAQINGEPCGSSHTDAAYANGVFRVWTSGVRIDADAYAALLNTRPASPELPVNFGALPSIF